ncbi:MAG: hypothetical protein BGO09_14065 [Bacteroidetes bacterium 47-18]|nr:MAG: hypothetical protein BGO09_14065 [Bacteroidetes bacterium 47-18]
MINKQHIAQYIAFLFQQKNGQQAPQEIIDSWQQIEESAIQEHLQGLYNHWQMSPQESQRLEQAFLKSLQPAAPLFDIPRPDPVSSQADHNPAAYNNVSASSAPIAEPRAASGSSKGLVTGLVIALLAVSGVAGYFLLNDNNNPPADNTTNVPDITAQPAVNTLPTAEPAAPPASVADTGSAAYAATDKAQNEDDKANAATLQKLMDAEYRQNIYNIYSTFSENMERYWGVNYPTFDEIKKLYDDSWNKRTNIKHDDVVIEKVGYNKYNVTATYSYYDLEKQQSVQKQTRTRYEFDSNHKIVRTYGL